jgi:S1-C subfamily serine protease
MPFDFTAAMMQATVQVEQTSPTAPIQTGTGILVSDPLPDGAPRVVLLTARHVIERIAAPQLQIGIHVRGADGTWRREWRVEPVADGGRPLWVRHPVYDLAALSVSVEPETAALAIPVSWLGDADSFARANLTAGDAVETLGYPQGLAADARGFAILRVGHLSTYDMAPAADGAFLIDMSVTSGDSGGPVFTSRKVGRRPELEGAQGPQPDEYVAGLITQQIVPGGQPIGLALAVHALYLRETLRLLDVPAAAAVPQSPAPAPRELSTH